MEFNETKTAADEVTTTLGDSVDNSEVPYTNDILNALCHRYEEPQANNRWDSPLFVIVPDSEFVFNDVYAVLYEKKPPPPNLSTQNVSDAQPFVHCMRFVTHQFKLIYITSVSVRI